MFVACSVVSIKVVKTNFSMPAVKKNPKPDINFYGLEFPADASELDVELVCYRDGAPLSPGRPHHFRRVVDLLWNHEGSSKKFIWHPWAEEMNEVAALHKYLGVAGCASSGKTDFFAVWGIVEWLCAPHATKVIYTSTSLKDSRNRIWSTVEDYFQAVHGMPGKLVSSQGVVRFDANGLQSDKFGLSLIACDKKKGKEATNKFLGYKAPRLRLVADELPELAESVLTTAYSNLAQNEEFRMIGIGNPNSHYDPFGLFCEPADGWQSVNESFYRWKTKRGFFIRFDGERSPNILSGVDTYPFLVTKAKLEQAKLLGEKSPAYYRMMKGFWCPSGESDAVYSEADIEKFGGQVKAEWSADASKTLVASLDASFTFGGDRCLLRFGTVGTSVEGRKVLELGDAVMLTGDVTDMSTPHSYQICKKIKEHCTQRGIHPRNFALDSTGPGAPFADILAVMWSPEILRVNFAGAASDRPVSSSEQDVPASDRYYDRVTELWFSGKELLRAGQLRGLDPTTITEMCNRKYSTVKGRKLLLAVEPKVEMKNRTNESPDNADAAFIMVELARTRLGFSSAEKVRRKSSAASASLSAQASSSFRRTAARLSMTARSGNYFNWS